MKTITAAVLQWFCLLKAMSYISKYDT